MAPLNLQLGTDLVYMPRLEKHLENDKFLSKVLTMKERELFDALKSKSKKLEFLSGRFASKEAYAKAKGVGIGTISFHDFEVLKDDLGKPISEKAMVSISHDHEYAIAVVIAYA